MKNIWSNIAIILSATAIASCSVSATQGATKPGEVSGGLFGLVKQDDLKVQEEKAFAGVNEVIVASFKVAFITEGKNTAKAGVGFGGASTAKSELKGVGDGVMQEITNSVYKDFVANMKAKGIKILDRSELLADKDFKDVKTYDFPINDDGTRYFTPVEFGKKSYFFPGESADYSGGFAFGNAMTGAALYAERAHKKVISVLYTVNYINAEGSGNSRWASSSSLEVGQGISVTPGSKLTIVGGQGGTFSSNIGNISLGQSVYSTKEFGTIKNTNSDAYKVAETALNVASALLGGGTNQTREFEVKADATKYKAIATEVLKDTNKAIVNRMATLK